MSEMLGEAGFPYRDGETVAFHAGRVLKAFKEVFRGSEEVADAIIDILLQNKPENSVAFIRGAYERLSPEEQATLMAKYDGSETKDEWEDISGQKLNNRADLSVGRNMRQRRSIGKTILVQSVDSLSRSWRGRAACLGMNTDEFFGSSISQEAKKACGRCSVSSECLSEAIKNKETGYWGGTTENYRNKRLQPRQAK